MVATEFWDEPILPREYIESSCGSCHREQFVQGADRLNNGRRLIEDLGCVGCHIIGDFKKSFSPSLDGIGDKVNRQWLLDWLLNPYDLKSDTRMPDFQFSEEDASALADFLMTFKEYSYKPEPLPPDLKIDSFSDEMIDFGKARFREARCISCHTVDEKGGSLASEIGEIGSKVYKEWLYNFLKNPQKMQPGIPMPQFGFNEKELMAVIVYMISELKDWDREETEEPDGPPAVDRFERGRELFNEYNCVGCHRLSYPNVSKNMGPDLTFMGDKSIYELPESINGEEVVLTSYIFGKLDSPRQYAGNLRMPKYNLSEEQKINLTVAVLAQTNPGYPRDYLRGDMRMTPQRMEGKFGEIVEKHSCLSCHVINGEGYLLATDLTFEGSRVQREWLKGYFRLPYTIRPILTERMPNLYMSDEEINTMVEYFDLVLVSDTISGLNIDTGDIDLISEGRELFLNKYGCQSCHQIDGAGGYVGPPLDHVGSRLTPGWVYSWISNPRIYRPDTVEPDAGLTDDEARAITAFLMSKQ
jgi:mono/diheme cytochrome c family protein